MSLAEIRATAEAKMGRTIEAYKSELHKIRTGRAHPGILDQVQVDYYGSMVPITQVASVSLLDARTISDFDNEAMIAAVREAVHDLRSDSLVLVACSGGADSLALAAATAFVAPRAGLRAGAVVVDHALIPESAAVAARAAEQCRGLGLDPVRVG